MNTMTRTSVATTLLLAAAAVRAQSADCEALAQWTDGSDLAISEATFYPDRATGGPGGGQTLPPHCHVTAASNTVPVSMDATMQSGSRSTCRQSGTVSFCSRAAAG